ncbi:MAG: lamin tail domain-containing protein [Thermoanaerobaculia bacterium]
MRTNLRVAIMLAAGFLIALPARAQQVTITQFYEGASFNKWIELRNISNSAVDFATGGWTLGLWTNANTEGYKTSVAPNNSVSLASLGTVAPGGVVLIRHASAVLPNYAVADADLDSSAVINFNGDDSIVLFTGGLPFASGSIVDAIGFTDLGNEGADKSFVRVSLDPGWDTTAGSNATSFPTVWVAYTNAQVDGATAGAPEYLGESTLPVELESFDVE